MLGIIIFTIDLTMIIGGAVITQINSIAKYGIYFIFFGCLIGLITGFFWLKSDEANINNEEIEEAYGQRGLTDEEKAEVEKLAKAFVKDILKNQNKNNKDEEVA